MLKHERISHKNGQFWVMYAKCMPNTLTMKSSGNNFIIHWSHHHSLQSCWFSLNYRYRFPLRLRSNTTCFKIGATTCCSSDDEHTQMVVQFACTWEVPSLATTLGSTINFSKGGMVLKHDVSFHTVTFTFGTTQKSAATTNLACHYISIMRQFMV
jgi:hypothetical protein